MSDLDRDSHYQQECDRRDKMWWQSQDSEHREWMEEYNKRIDKLHTGETEMNVNELYPSKFLKSSDLKGHKIRVVIESIVNEEVQEGKTKPVIYFKGKDKGLALNKSNAMIIASVYSPETDGWVGKEIVLYSGKVQFNGQMVDSLKVEIPQREANPDDVGF